MWTLADIAEQFELTAPQVVEVCRQLDRQKRLGHPDWSLVAAIVDGTFEEGDVRKAPDEAPLTVEDVYAAMIWGMKATH